MQHPFDSLAPEYSALLVRMQIMRVAAVDTAAARLVSLIDAGRYAQACAVTGVPQAGAAASFEREASSNFKLSPAQGDPINEVSRHVPRGLGPYPDWTMAAIAAYRIDHLDAIGAANWSWQRACYEWELYNGFGYRARGIQTPYLWAGTNIYTRGKFIADGQFDPSAEDSQLGVIPMMARIVQLRPALKLPIAFPTGDSSGTLAPISPPAPAPIGLHDAAALQRLLNSKGADPQLTIDDSYGRETRYAVELFQKQNGLMVDGLAGPPTWAKLAA